MDFPEIKEIDINPFVVDEEGGVVIDAKVILDEQIANDPRFLFFNPDDPGKNYNYNANQVLVEAIRDGYRGAYWDILRRI